MEMHFAKWHGTGNDFILVDDRTGFFPADPSLVRRLCDRHFGIGSDGLILIQAPRLEDTAFHMEFFNPDASKSFCGNGSRCAFAFWRSLVGDEPGQIAGEHTSARFTAIDGEHGADVRGTWEVGVTLRPPSEIEFLDGRMDFIDTGSPHLLVWVDDPSQLDLITEAHAFRYNVRFRRLGVNVNFLRWDSRSERLDMRTYERGVEAETLSCGTGVTAAALDAIHRGVAGETAVSVRTRGGDLRVEAYYDQVGSMPRTVTLIGPVVHVFSGSISI